ncbi:hypothetical protein [Puniceicoccus vermicola]|uniref:PEP-CTERM sorting domain-containing protein n=1 Tax=Puniceicoccus vermicola TaxID=388746 RepID=A0A7X1AZ87_9BACT|nr:hypothetical protein [Puniceicoccus vermicola]MBC2602642.1 hypothetical protein [Puniceicoccus vermicola]
MKSLTKSIVSLGLTSAFFLTLPTAAQAASGTLVDFNFTESPFSTLPSTQDATYTIGFAAGSNFGSGNYSGSGNLYARGTGSGSLAYSSTVGGSADVVDAGTGSYFDFSLTPAADQEMTLTSFSVDVGAQRLGNTSVDDFTISYFIRSSQDSYVSNLATVNRYVGEGSGTTGNNYTNLSVDLIGNSDFENIASLEEVTFRVYAVISTGTVDSNQLMRMDNVLITGSTSSIPEPTSVALGLGMVAMLWVARRRCRA